MLGVYLGWPRVQTILMSSRQRKVANIQLTSDLCDLTVPATALGYTNFDDGIVGLAGTLSSLLGIQGVWEKTG